MLSITTTVACESSGAKIRLERALVPDTEESFFRKHCKNKPWPTLTLGSWLDSALAF